MSSAPTRQAIFSLYRELFAMIHALPNKQKTNALTSLREGFRRNHNVSGEKAMNLFKVNSSYPNEVSLCVLSHATRFVAISYHNLMSNSRLYRIKIYG